jgi:hypothetical protein
MDNEAALKMQISLIDTAHSEFSSHRAVALALGMAPQQYYRYVHGKSVMSLAVYHRLLTLLGKEKKNVPNN